MTRRLGGQQLYALSGIGRPTAMIVVGDKITASLVKRGLARAEDDGAHGSWVRITAAGLRALADEMDAGRIEDPHAVMLIERDERNRKKAETA